MSSNSERYYHGNQSLLKEHKIAFLCSRKCPAPIILKTYDWAIAQRNAGKCIVSGFHSTIEQDVLHYLLKGDQPIIVALARGLKQRYPEELHHALNNNRLLIVSPFETSVTRVTQETSNKRNEMMAELADEIFVSHAHPGGNIERLIQTQIKNRKRVTTFDLSENENLIGIGVGKLYVQLTYIKDGYA